MNEVQTLHKSIKPDGGTIKLELWPEGYVLWFDGEIVWRQWKPTQTEVTVSIDSKAVSEMINKEIAKLERLPMGRKI